MRKVSRRQNNLYRIIDANINRTKEGLRVCEEIARFIVNSRTLTLEFKRIRHRIDLLLKILPPKARLLENRKSLTDVGRFNTTSELQRKSYRDIFFANIQRVKESLRVLEEFTKLDGVKTAVGFKKIRYDIYEIEKKVIKRISSLSNYR